MTNVSLALAKAGIQLPPLNERVWNCLKDSKVPRTGKTVAQMIGAKPADVAGVLSNMAKRRMVAVNYQTETVKVGRGYARKEIGHYTAVGSQFELRPMPMKTEAQVHVPVFIEPPKPKALRADDIDLESMKLSEAHALYKRLREFFA